MALLSGEAKKRQKQLVTRLAGYRSVRGLRFGAAPWPALAALQGCNCVVCL